MNRALAWLLAAGVCVAAGAVELPELKAGVFSPPHPAPEFRLAGSDGAPLTLARFHGKVVALAFGYSHCADVCPVALATLAQARKQLGAQAAGFQVVYVTVDPERDTVKRMHDYLHAFDPTFIGATGTPQQMAKIRQDYGITATRKNIAGSKDYVIGHSSFLYFVDRKGALRALLPFGRTADDVVHDATLLLKN